MHNPLLTDSEGFLRHEQASVEAWEDDYYNWKARLNIVIEAINKMYSQHNNNREVGNYNAIKEMLKEIIEDCGGRK